jgi:hypothetical protein
MERIKPLRNEAPNMSADDFRQSLTADKPPAGLTLELVGLVGCEGRLETGALSGEIGLESVGL